MIGIEDLKALDEKKVGPCSFRRVEGRWVLTNDIGRWVQLEDADFRRFLRGELKEGTPTHEELKSKGFLREWLDFGELAEAWRSRNDFLMRGTGLHIVVVTLRCNQKCV
jgi:hypothetical protein